MTRKEYEAKYGTAPAISAPVKMTRSEYENKYNQKKPSYLSRVLGQYQQAGQDITQGIQQGAQDYQKGESLSLARAGLRTVGGVAEAAFAPISEAPGIKQGLEKISEVVTKIPGVEELVQKANDLAQRHPESAKDIKNIVDIATLGFGKTVEKPLVSATENVGKKAVEGTKLILTPSEESVKRNIEGLFSRAIKPTGKKTLAQTEVYKNDVINALKTIKTKSPQLNIQDSFGELVSRTPETINELAQALDQTKKLVFNDYDSLAKQAGKLGALVNAENVAKELDVVASNKALGITNPELVQYAQGWSQRLRQLGNLDAQTTQEVVQNLNQSLSAFYKNPTYESATRVAIDAGIANNFRKELDTAIEGATGKEYQALKNQYKALKTIENDVIRAANREARKNARGLLDYTDIFTGGQMLSGILSLNPAMFTKGAVERGIKEYIKFLNDPNRAIGSIFKKLDKPTRPKLNTTGGFIKSPLTKSDPLLTEARKYKSAEEFVKAQGQTIYHGTAAKFDVFDDAMKGSVTGAKSAHGATWFTDNPDVAKAYSVYAAESGPINKLLREHDALEKIAKRSGKQSDWAKVDELTQKIDDLGDYDATYQRRLDNANVKEAVAKGDFYTVDARGKTPQELSADGDIDSWLNVQVEKAKKLGKDGLIIKNLDDAVGLYDRPSTHYAIFDSKKILTKSQLTDIWKKANKR